MQTARTRLGWGVGIAVVLSLVFNAQAGFLKQRARHADRNKDGRVDAKEAKMEKHIIKEKSKVDRPWEKKADKNGDGRVDLVELKQFHRALIDTNNDGVLTPEERKAYWVQFKARVTNEAEKKYDANGDGVLTGDEAESYMKDRLTVIRTDGKAVANTDIEKQFDADGDGVIDTSESDALKDALGL